MKRDMLIVLSSLLLALAPLACGKKHDPSVPFAIDTTMPELDLSEVSGFVSLDKAEVPASGMRADLSLTLNVLKDFGGKQLVLQIYQTKAVPFGPPVPVPAPVDGKISWTIQGIDTWRTMGRGVFRLIEPAR